MFGPKNGTSSAPAPNNKSEIHSSYGEWFPAEPAVFHGFIRSHFLCYMSRFKHKQKTYPAIYYFPGNMSNPRQDFEGPRKVMVSSDLLLPLPHCYGRESPDDAGRRRNAEHKKTIIIIGI